VIGPGRFILPPLKANHRAGRELAQPKLNNKFGWLMRLIG
jgi:hypothetical protein